MYYQVKIMFTLKDNFFVNLTCQIFHICRLYINNIKTLRANFQVPKVYSQIISRYESFAITRRYEQHKTIQI